MPSFPGARSRRKTMTPRSLRSRPAALFLAFPLALVLAVAAGAQGLQEPRSVYEATASFEHGEVASIQAHLGRVLECLRSKEVSGLTPEQREQRRLHIERL